MHESVFAPSSFLSLLALFFKRLAPLTSSLFLEASAPDSCLSGSISCGIEGVIYKKAKKCWRRKEFATKQEIELTSMSTWTTPVDLLFGRRLL
jgi:hypothetical protein